LAPRRDLNIHPSFRFTIWDRPLQSPATTGPDRSPPALRVVAIAFTMAALRSASRLVGLSRPTARPLLAARPYATVVSNATGTDTASSRPGVPESKRPTAPEPAPEPAARIKTFHIY